MPGATRTAGPSPPASAPRPSTSLFGMLLAGRSPAQLAPRHRARTSYMFPVAVRAKRSTPDRAGNTPRLSSRPRRFEAGPLRPGRGSGWHRAAPVSPCGAYSPPGKLCRCSPSLRQYEDDLDPSRPGAAVSEAGVRPATGASSKVISATNLAPRWRFAPASCRVSVISRLYHGNGRTPATRAKHIVL
jgi:hypothetical protein